ncbi:hypothetical protein ES703_74175 [subsurface metagenome]
MRALDLEFLDLQILPIKERMDYLTATGKIKYLIKKTNPEDIELKVKKIKDYEFKIFPIKGIVEYEFNLNCDQKCIGSKLKEVIIRYEAGIFHFCCRAKG